MPYHAHEEDQRVRGDWADRRVFDAEGNFLLGRDVGRGGGKAAERRESAAARVAKAGVVATATAAARAAKAAAKAAQKATKATKAAAAKAAAEAGGVGQGRRPGSQSEPQNKTLEGCVLVV